MARGPEFIELELLWSAPPSPSFQPEDWFLDEFQQVGLHLFQE